MSCRRVRDWLHLDADRLDDAQRLLLDDHLGACERCRDDRERMRVLHRVGAALSVPPAGAGEYQRAIARALLEGAPRTGDPSRAVRRWWPVPLVVAAAVAAVVIAMLSTGGPPNAPVTGQAPPPSPAPAPTPAPPARPEIAPPEIAPALAGVVDDGALAHDDDTIEAGGAVPTNALVRAIRRSRLRLISAQVVVSASAELRWLPTERSVVLARGALDVETGPNGIARIVTERFEVELDDATVHVDVDVDLAAVRVVRGRVRVVDRSRAALAVVEAGTTWSSDAAAQPAPIPARRATPAELLTEARARFAARDHAAAARLANEILGRSPARAVAAEAHTILADVALADDDLARAVHRYEKVAERYRDLPAAESALYAAARIELRRNRPAAARALLERYLERYPAGRYADDARRQLASTP